MNRKEFITRSLGTGCCALMAFKAADTATGTESGSKIDDEDPEKIFVQNWLTDLLDTIESELDEATAIRLIEGCGRGCFRRHQFKQDLAEEGKGDVDRLIEALKKNFEIWREGDEVHIRYGAVSSGCYCPAAKYRPPKPDDLHCECSRSSHQTIWETALGWPFKVDILESVRRGNPTCHFLVHLT